MQLAKIKQMAPYILSAIFFVALDRLAKAYATIVLQEKFYYLVGDILKLRLAENKFIAFSLPLGGSILVVLNTLIILVLFYFLTLLIRENKFKLAGPLLFVLAGAMSNMFDRFKWGYVIDYFDLKYFTVFNIADMMIVLGVISIIILQFTNKKI